MPSRLRIPDPYVPGLMGVAALADETVTELQTAVTDVPRLLTAKRLTEHVGERVPALSRDASDILEALLSLTTLLPEDGDGVAELAREVADSRDLELEQSVRDVLAERLTTLLRLDAFVLAARASEIVTEYPKVFHDARILNDLRPVFGPDASKGVKAALLVATLKLEYHLADGPVDSDFFALDYRDLLRLREVIDRAVAKHASMRGLVDKMDLPFWEYIESDGGDD
jgi:hypothetical protein